jgi:hypothetical protein
MSTGAVRIVPGTGWDNITIISEGLLMGTTAIIAAIDKELARLHEVRSMLVKQKKGAKTGTKASAGAASKKAKRNLSPAGRARIAEAQRKRWAAARKKT